MGMIERAAWLGAIFVTSAAIAATPGADAFAASGTAIHNRYDGVTNDLLTAGLGKSGLGSPVSPATTFADPLKPTAEELRKLAIYNNYRALVDPTAAGGYGTLYGPNVRADGTITTSEGLIAGDEYIVFDSDGGKNVTLMVQAPDSFDPKNACIVTAPSSGSRGIYGAIATAGEWALKHNCAVAYTDKGSGTGADDLQNGIVNLIRGEAVPVAQAGDDAIFQAELSPSQLADFNAQWPNRFAFKHAHSRQNPEKDWGKNVLASIRFAFHVLASKYGNGVISKRNTLVIASSVSNGGGASVRAVEQDTEHLIDGVAVGEPNVNPVFLPVFTIQQGASAPLRNHSRPLIDYITLVNVFQGCANAAPANKTAPFNLLPSPARCASLKSLGLLRAATTDDQATEAQKIINDFGILAEQNLVQPGYWAFDVSRSISVTYANAYGRVSVADNLCAFSLGATSLGKPAPLPAVSEAQLFGTSNGIPTTAGVDIVNNAAPGGPAKDAISTPDQNLTGALCLRSVGIGKDAVTGVSFGTPDPRRAFARRISDGVEEILANGRLNRVPAVFVTGRNDGILPPNFASRAYYGLNKTLEGANSPLRYYEITNAHHLDTLNQIQGYGALFNPLHRYYIQALDLMYDHLKNKRPLPPSQVVRTTPRGPGAPPITLANVPPILQAPAAGNLIAFTPGHLFIPE